MANRLKTGKDKASGRSPFKPEKDEKVSMKDLAKDERTHKIAGSISLLICLFLFLAFTSYLFTWKEDQDKIYNNGLSVLLPSAKIKTANLLGNLGAYISHQFFYYGFGLASYFFCTLFFVIGINAMFKNKIFSLWRNIRYVIVGVLFFSVALAFFAGNSNFPWGGEVGNMVSNWLVRMIGNIGTTALLFVCGLAYIIWRFNPVFKAPKVNLKRKASENTLNIPVDAIMENMKETGSDEEPVAGNK